MITERVDLNVPGWPVPPTWITTASPLAAVLVPPSWRVCGCGSVTGSSGARKVALGLAQIGVAYSLLLLITITTGNTDLGNQHPSGTADWWVAAPLCQVTVTRT
ncbi:peptide MFS transporter [Streptomyces rhizosphaericus]|uniref:Peptide MFS transporter n=1 Tax=Streptomyces rhizosphaericus TaxID=114699 RepID=A0A6G4AI54_9ACTN|nr:peptide MFS transporter [Streptomyces rhizosphaericus]NEW72918.1 peptide MFS transporter [Streptomyces rhizosphaericus]